MYDRSENLVRVRQGLISILSGRKIEFSNDQWNLMALFCDPITKFSQGRVLLFQNHFVEHAGTIPEIVSQMPACLKIFFRIEAEEPEVKKKILDIISSDSFSVLCRDLNVSAVQFGGQLIHPLRDGTTAKNKN